MKKKHIYDIDLEKDSLAWVRELCKKGYMETGLKFAVNFNGSKGYLDHIEIISEGPQVTGKNYLSRSNFLSDDRPIFSVFYVSNRGVLIETKMRF